jgi:ribosomal protein S12 methylthiotransferase accessory factor
MSEIYPLDDLEWENNSDGNVVRADILRLSELNDDECCELLDTLNELNIADERPVAALIGLAADPDSLWADLRVGELKTMLALAGGDPDALREGLEWVHRFEPLEASRRRIYACLQTLIDMDDPADYETALFGLYGEETLDQAVSMLDGEIRFFGLVSPGLALTGCDLHQRLLKEYEKAQASAA